MASLGSLGTIDKYIGGGQAGVWTDPANWAGGHVPGATNTALIQQAGTFNGTIEVNNLMLLGQGTDTFTGAVQSDSTNDCTSFMVCEGAVANFVAGSSMLVKGGFLTGVDAVGTTDIAGASGGKAAATLSTVAFKVGIHDDGTGTINIAGVLNASAGTYIGQDGHGTVNVTGAGVANLGNLVLGENSGAVGAVNLSGSGQVDVAGWTSIGTSLAGAPGGIGTATVAGGSTLYCDHSIFVNDGSAVVLSGGIVSLGVDGTGFQVEQGATVSGHGTINSTNQGTTDRGVIESSGGTLVIDGNITGAGALQIGAGSTLDLNASKIGVGSISFLGTGDTLGLTAPVHGLTFGGFAAGDQIVLSGVDALSWNSSTDVLSLSDGGHLVDQMTFSGEASGASFHLGQSSAGAIITLVPPNAADGACGASLSLLRARP